MCLAYLCVFTETYFDQTLIWLKNTPGLARAVYHETGGGGGADYLSWYISDGERIRKKVWISRGQDVRKSRQSAALTSAHSRCHLAPSNLHQKSVLASHFINTHHPGQIRAWGFSAPSKHCSWWSVHHLRTWPRHYLHPVRRAPALSVSLSHWHWHSFTLAHRSATDRPARHPLCSSSISVTQPHIVNW